VVHEPLEVHLPIWRGTFIVHRVPTRYWKYWKSIEFRNWFSKPWKSIEFDQNVHWVL